MENLRRQLIYNVFVQHFIEMAQVSYVFRSLNQGLIYLKQAERICSLLTDDHGVEESRRFLTKIYGVRNEIQKAINNASYRPALPKRASPSAQSPQQRRIRMKSPKQNGRKGRASYSNVSPNSFSPDDTPRQSPERARKRSSRQLATSVQVHSAVRGSPQTSTSDDQDDISRLLGNVTIGA